MIKTIIRKKKCVCPFCKCDKFLRRNSDIIKMSENDIGINEEVINCDVEAFEYFCLECGKDLTNEELKVVR